MCLRDVGDFDSMISRTSWWLASYCVLDVEIDQATILHLENTERAVLEDRAEAKLMSASCIRPSLGRTTSSPRSLASGRHHSDQHVQLQSIMGGWWERGRYVQQSNS
jgi:hypothetical protein